MHAAQTLYHFTSPHHVVPILAGQRLMPSESNVGSPLPWQSPTGAKVGPDVVWLLDTDDLRGLPHNLVGRLADKTAIRFTVAVPAIRWMDWTPATKMNPQWREAFVQAGGGPKAAEHWFVFPGPIPSQSWLAVDDLRAGSALCPVCGQPGFRNPQDCTFCSTHPLEVSP